MPTSFLEGDNHFGNGVKVGTNCVIKNCKIADGVEIVLIRC